MKTIHNSSNPIAVYSSKTLLSAYLVQKNPSNKILYHHHPQQTKPSTPITKMPLSPFNPRYPPKTKLPYFPNPPALSLAADEAVGLIILSKNPLSTSTFPDFSGTTLLLPVSSFFFGGGGPQVGFALRPASPPPILTRVPTPFTLGLGGATTALPSAFSFAADDAVGATRCAGSLSGRVGDFGRGFVKPMPRSMLPGSVMLLAREERVEAVREGWRVRE